MNKIATDLQVLETKKYGKFSFLDGNRPLKEFHLKFLGASISKRDLRIPIIVNEKFQIIDGQHRFQVLRDLNLPIPYIIKKGFTLDEVHVLNTNRKNWSTTEFMHSYADLGFEEYIRYREFYKKYKFGHHESMAMLSKGSLGGIVQFVERFKEGEFVVKDYDKGIEWAEMITMVKDFYLGYKRRYFVLTMIRLFNHKDYVHAEFLSRLRYQRDRLYDMTSVNSYLRIIEDIYNYRRSEKVSFYQNLKA